MTASVPILIMACFFVKANSVENIYADNGWRPMSSEKVFALQRNFIRTPIQSEGNTMANVYQRGNAIKIVNPNAIHLNKESIKADEAIFSLQGIERNGRAFEVPTETAFEETTQRDYTKNSSRKAKRISESDVILLTDNTIQNPSDTNDNSKSITDTKSKKESTKNTYEVYERSIQDNVLNDQDDLKPLNSNGYTYAKPKVAAKANNTLTSKLFNILANYNIRSGDKLPNYALSLRQNSRNSNDNYVYMHVPIKIPLRYNSPNHYPIDPLLAVFLSNYGHYLPGLYGFQRSYNNLYGYLASNNIHNNNPTGSYKVFSDTDSFH